MKKIALLASLLFSLVLFSIEYLPNSKAFSATSVAVSSDGEKLVAGYIDNTIKVWSLLDGRLLNNLSFNSSWVTAVAVSPDGKKAVAGYDDGMIIVWDLDTGRKIKSLSSHTSAVNDLIVTKDSKILFSCSSDATVKVWSLTDLAFIRTLRGHSGSVFSIVDWPEQNRLYSASEDGTLRIWDYSTGQQVKVIRAEIGALTAVSMDEERSILILGSEAGQLKSYDVKTWSSLRTTRAHNAQVTKILIDNEVAYTASNDRTIKLLSLPSFSLINMITGHTWDVTEIALSMDGYVLYSSSTDGKLKVWDIEKASTIGTLIGFGDGEYFSYNSQGNWVSSSKAKERVACENGSSPVEVGKELSFILLQLDKLPRIYTPSEQEIDLENSAVSFTVSQPVTRVTVDEEEVAIEEGGFVIFTPDGEGTYTLRAYDSSGSYDERTITVKFKETVMYVVKEICSYQRGDKVLVDDYRNKEFLVNGEWVDESFLSRSAPDVEPPIIIGERTQKASIGENKYLTFSVSDNGTVTAAEVIAPDLTVSRCTLNSTSTEIAIEVQGTGVYTVNAYDSDGNKTVATFSLEAGEESFWLSKDYGNLRKGQQVKVTEEGESCYYVSDYGWVEKDYLSRIPVSTGEPIIDGVSVQYASSAGEKILSFNVSDDVSVREVVVSGKSYPVNEREREMHIIVNEYGEHLVVAKDVEGNSSEAIFTLSAPTGSEKSDETLYFWLIPILAIALLVFIRVVRSSKKKSRKVRL
ncbi:MAG: WD40 repeat domain-containing protein [Kosmotogaceae bacterium]|nr:WD40 repeat domain-containing protein [Kosmotogaceae bacterium]